MSAVLSQVMMRIIAFVVIFLTISHGTQAAPGDVFDALVEKTQEARNTATVPYNACGEAGKKEFVALAAESWYLWYEELAQVSPEDFETAQAYLDAITRH